MGPGMAYQLTCQSNFFLSLNTEERHNMITHSVLYHFPPVLSLPVPELMRRLFFLLKEKVEKEKGTTPLREQKCYITKTKRTKRL